MFQRDPNPANESSPFTNKVLRLKHYVYHAFRGLEYYERRRRLAALSMDHSPMFAQNVMTDRLQTNTNRLDFVALDIMRDRERSVPRLNESRRQ